MGWFTYVFSGTGTAGLVLVLWGIVKDVRSGNLRKSRSKADQAEVEVEQLEQVGPIIHDGLRINQADLLMAAQGRAVTMLGEQLASANERIAERDRQLAESDADRANLRRQIRERDEQIDELELRLGVAEDELRRARSIITDLRANPDHTSPPPAG